MAEDMLRVIVYDRTDTYVCDLDPTQILDLKSTSEVNGEHSLTIKTTQELAKTDRLVIRDAMGVWHEYVVDGIVGEHGSRKVGGVVHEYHAVWSIQYDLSATYIDTNVGIVPGHPSVPHSARDALEAALSGTSRWSIGTITVTDSGSASFYRRSGWEGMQTVTENWGGEVDVTITVGASGVTGRAVNLLEHVGASTAVRRFDYGGDVSRIKRTVSDDVWPCRIVPLGKASETEAGGYSRRPTIASVNGGIPWLEDSSATPYVKVPDGQGGWEYPTSIIKNDVYADPADLKAWAQANIGKYTRPQVSYEADVVQLVKAGLNPHGVALGDEVIVVDRDFGADGLAISARVVKMVQSLLDSTDLKLTIGNAKLTLAGQLGTMSREIQRASDNATGMSTYQSTASFLSDLIGRLNGEINATGGYTYITEGEGIRTYDVAVSDPLVGAEASYATDVRGGTIRLANTKTAQGEWIWRTVLVSGHIAADMVTAGQITAGYIGSAASGNYWDLDAGTLTISADIRAGGLNNQNGTITVYNSSGDVIGSIDNDGVVFSLSVPYYASGSTSTDKNGVTVENGIAIAAGGNTYADLTGATLSSGVTANLVGLRVENERAGTARDRILIIPCHLTSSSSNSYHSTIAASGNLDVIPFYEGGVGSGALRLRKNKSRIEYSDSSYSAQSYVECVSTGAQISGKTVTVGSNVGTGNTVSVIANASCKEISATKVTVSGSLTVSGTKNRAVRTKDYGNRLLYSDETPSPTFTDYGSGTLGEDGLCYVEVDDVFAETARTDLAYQVFLQACGRGELWVAEKRPTHFIVAGEPGLAFDWMMKARQAGYENERMEDMDLRDGRDAELGEEPDVADAYAEELALVCDPGDYYGQIYDTEAA